MKFLTLRPVPPEIRPRPYILGLVTWLHSGRLQPASGSWGSLAALPALLLADYIGGWPVLLFFILICFVAGLQAISIYIRQTGRDDPSEIVLDELVGLGVALLPVATWRLDSIVLAFALFRLFDAVKIGPVGWCDRHLPGAWGVLLDDIIAGLMAAFCVYAYQSFIS